MTRTFRPQLSGQIAYDLDCIPTSPKPVRTDHSDTPGYGQRKVSNLNQHDNQLLEQLSFLRSVSRNNRQLMRRSILRRR